ncbi:hypothetical protein BKI52_29670 [marine bacterium AO1-C]|nr:hypothetical protein BKI52_29670 [marine bacterium AO1-C]
MKWKQRLFKIYKWEFWPFWFFYIPVYFYWAYSWIRTRSMFFFSAANPAMEMGGFIDYSKIDIFKKIPGDILPNMVFISTPKDKENIENILAIKGLEFPLIAKPDKGERGKDVAKIKNLEDLKTYLAAAKEQIILQEFITHPLEFGIMYYRLPNEDRGHITSVVQKEFLTVCGNGASTVRELMRSNQRTALYEEHVEMSYPELLEQVPAEGEKKLLEPIGNHCRGTVFRNANHLINEHMVEVFDNFSKQIDGFYFGRYDIKVPSLEDLYAGKNIVLMELNGANSEPAHIYDPNMDIWTAYTHLIKHWRILYKISVQNHKRGVHYMSRKVAFPRLVQHYRD